MTSKSTVLLITAVAAAGLLTFSPSVRAGVQNNSQVSETITAKKVTSRGKDSNIQRDRSSFATDGKFGGKPTKTRGKRGEFHVDNMTGYYIDLYGNGDFLGTVGPYGDHYTIWSSGSLRFYAKSAGGSSSWGPRTYTMDRDTTVTLNDEAAVSRGKAGDAWYAECSKCMWCSHWGTQWGAEQSQELHNKRTCIPKWRVGHAEVRTGPFKSCNICDFF